MSESRRAVVAKALLEMVLVGFGVFLAMTADQWRSDRQHREQARAALQRFKVEIEANKAAVEKVADYHVRIRRDIVAYLNPKTRAASNLRLEGVMPAMFEHTAWDLALATQALADIDASLAYELTRVYGLQQLCVGLTSGLTQAMYLRPPSADLTAFLQSLKVYYDDMVIHEPALIEMYSRILPLLDGALKD
jgi:hypothetical protein